MLNSKNEIIVDRVPDGQVLLVLAKSALEETAKLFGPIFIRMVTQSTLFFEKEMLKQEPPASTKLDDVINYIIANLGGYPKGYCSLIYGIGKAESKLEGAWAAGGKRAAYNAMKKLIETSGLLASVIGSTEDLFEALDKFVEMEKAMNTASPLRLIRQEKGQVNMVVPDCPYMDACRALDKEGIARMYGGLACMMLIGLSAAAEIITKSYFDYKLEKFDNPECIGKIYKL